MRRFWSSALLVGGVALAVMLVQLLLGIRLSEGHGVYTLDDAYIHLALARNLAQHGVWGLRPESYTFCSSSPLWTVLLAGGIRLLGKAEWLPGLLNYLFAVLALWVVDGEARRRGVSWWWRVALGLGLFLLVPMAVIASTGMEHTLHLWLTLLLLVLALRVLEGMGCEWWLVLVAGLSVGARYEALFVVGPLAAVFAWRRRWWLALGLLLTASLPVVWHGVYAVAHGGFFLPNSLMLKGRMPGGGVKGYFWQLFRFYVDVGLSNVHLHIVVLLLLLTAGLRRIPLALRQMNLVVVVAVVAHVTLAECGRFYRYEAYLMGAGLALLGWAWLANGRWRGVWPQSEWSSEEAWWAGSGRIALVGLLVGPLCLRGVWATSRVPRGAANIYQQQWQMAEIFKGLEGSGGVAINDLGAMCYRTGLELVDLWGLGTTEVARVKRQGGLTREYISELLQRKGVAYVAVYDEWYGDGTLLPESLIRVGSLTIPHNIVCAFETVQFYAADEVAAGRLAHRLDEMAGEMPAGVRLQQRLIRSGE